MLRININLIIKGLSCCKPIRKRRRKGCSCKQSRSNFTSKQVCNDSLNIDLFDLLEHVNKDATRQALKDLKESLA